MRLGVKSNTMFESLGTGEQEEGGVGQGQG
jgi:hypothetical protein